MIGSQNDGTKTGKKHVEFNRLFREYYRALYQFSYGLLGNPEEAEETTQEVFMKLHYQLRSPIPLQNPRAWLYRVATNTCYTLLKRKNKYRQIIEENFLEKRETAGVEGQASKDEERDILKKTIAELPAREQAVLFLYQEGFSYARMAKITGIKKSSIGVVISRAIDKVYRIIHETKGEEE